MLKQNFEQPANIKIMFNIGATFDIPTGFFVKGVHGEWILVGGLGGITAIVGRGNRFKSTILDFCMLSAMNRIFSTHTSSASTYDTEINIHEFAKKRFLDRFEYLKDLNILDDGTWVITDKTLYSGNKWFEKAKEFLREKDQNSNKLMVKTPFLSRDGKTPLYILSPTFGQVDSFSEFETDDVIKMQDENELGDSGANTIHMRQGLAKTRFLMEAPALFGKGMHFMLMTAHLDDAVQVAAGPYAPVPVKKLQYMNVGDKIKGVTGKFFFLMNNCWHAANASLMIEQKTKTPEYPRDSHDLRSGDTDLNEVRLTQLRGKSGPSGYSLNIVVSQTEGVLPSLTEFNLIKNYKDADYNRFGISGNNINYHLDILPDLNLTRPTIRSKIDENAKLRRALNITSELCQLHQFHRQMPGLCSAKELYDDLIKLGYDWDMILTKTRGWFALNDDKHPLLFLSIKDLLEARQGKIPYWMNEDKTIKDEYIRN